MRTENDFRPFVPIFLVSICCPFDPFSGHLKSALFLQNLTYSEFFENSDKKTSDVIIYCDATYSFESVGMYCPI